MSSVLKDFRIWMEVGGWISERSRGGKSFHGSFNVYKMMENGTEGMPHLVSRCMAGGGIATLGNCTEP